MTSRYTVGARGRKIAILGSGIAACAIAAVAIVRVEMSNDGPTEAVQLVDAATVAGFTRTAIVEVPDAYTSGAAAYFVGPAPRPDVLAAVSIPTMSLTASQPRVDVPGVADRSVVVARGSRPDVDDECGASVALLTPSTTEPSDPKWNLTQEQFNGVATKSLILIKISVYNCRF
ncbi:hypothetical protein [Nocardia asteroides]|uniref:Uncharacterized protein n=1 Tax=Nocardia asteroides NBRC 15531 TaxID=1110697 RepID=U5EHH6_NOCAS|nr:hypothetical protein [Nocardia asteroides]UGT48131.1 hypothetical protein LT345_27225 [Nocardia asteroides]GAD84609.1 hypothetical protein NCAST_25_00290 [Nocardia asteroides NBRC 15531]